MKVKRGSYSKFITSAGEAGGQLGEYHTPSLPDKVNRSPAREKRNWKHNKHTWLKFIYYHINIAAIEHLPNFSKSMMFSPLWMEMWSYPKFPHMLTLALLFCHAQFQMFINFSKISSFFPEWQEFFPFSNWGWKISPVSADFVSRVEGTVPPVGWL